MHACAHDTHMTSLVAAARYMSQNRDDWSGTLVDDSAPTLAATNAVLAKYGKDPMTWEHFRESFRLPYSEWYEEHVPGIALEELEEYFRAAFDCSDHVVTPLEGAADFLEWCYGNGIRLFVLTSMNVDCFRQQLVEFDFARFFECTYAGVVDKRSRIGEIMAAHGLEPTETAFVGDMAHDIDTAHHGGVTSVGVLSGYDPASRLVAARPGLMLSCIRSLHSLLMRTLPEAAARSQDAIVVRRLAVNCFVGVPEEERAEAQTLYLTLEIVPERSFAKLQDNIEDTVDYDGVARRTVELAEERPRKLIETLAWEVGDMVLSEFAAREVTVEVEKHILPETEAVLVRTHRVRHERG